MNLLTVFKIKHKLHTASQSAPLPRPLPSRRNILVAHLSPIPTLRCAAINRLIDF